MTNRSQVILLFRGPRVITCTVPLPKLHSTICILCHYPIWELLVLLLELQSPCCYLIWNLCGVTQAASAKSLYTHTRHVGIRSATLVFNWSVCHDVTCFVLCCFLHLHCYSVCIPHAVTQFAHIIFAIPMSLYSMHPYDVMWSATLDHWTQKSSLNTVKEFCIKHVVVS